MTSVFVSGGFDDIRSGDIRFLEEAAKFGPLTVRLLQDTTLGTPKFPFDERSYILKALRFVVAVEAADGTLLPNHPGAVFAEREQDASPTREQAARDQGLDYRVIANSALAGFSRAPTALSVGGKKVAVSGCYDWLHSGHVRFFEEAASLGDLHVFLGSDATICALKGPGHPQFSDAERRYVVSRVRHVFAAEISRGSGMLDFAEDVAALKPDVFLVNEDGDRPSKRDFCRERGIDYVVLKRRPADGLPQRSSTALRGF